MSTPSWFVAAALVGAAGVAGWPRRTRLARRRVLFATSRAPEGGEASPTGLSGRIRVSRLTVERLARTRMSSIGRSPPRAITVAAAGAGVLAVILAGPAAGVVAAAYGGVTVRAGLRRRSVQEERRLRARHLDQLGALAADLRAGLPITQPAWVGAAAPGRPGLGEQGQARLARLALAAVQLAERTGAPLADLIERIEADARSTDRTTASAAAQAAGARATAWLLAGLPIGGIALGYGIGVDPLDVLLHTPIGAGCVIATVTLQLAGLAWTERLSNAGERVI